MKGHSLFIFIIILFCSWRSYSQTIPKNLNVIDSKGRRQGTWTILFNRSDEVTADLDSLDHYRIIEYKNDRPFGKTLDYFPTGELEAEQTLIADRPEEVFDGTATEYRKDGTKKVVGVFVQGQIDVITFYDVHGEPTKESFEALSTQGALLVSQGYYEMALPSLEKAKSELQKGEGDAVDHAELLGYLGICYNRMGDFTKARSTLMESVGWASKAYSTNSPGYGRAVNNLGQLYLLTGDLSKAKQMFSKAREIFGAAIANKKTGYTGYYAAILGNLALVEVASGQFANAKPLLIEAKDLFAAAPDYKQLGYPESLLNLADMYQRTGDYLDAESTFLEAKGILEKVQGKTSPMYAMALVAIAGLYMDIGKYPSAESAYLEAQPIYQKNLGKDNPNTAALLTKLSQLYQIKGDYHKAESTLNEALRLFEKTIGKEHIEYGSALNTLGQLYYTTGAYTQAEGQYKTVLSLIEKSISSGANDGFPTLESAVLQNLALLYQMIGNFPRAEQLFTEALGAAERIYGKNHELYGTGLSNLGLFYQAMGNSARAEGAMRQAVTVMKSALGENHPGYAKTLNNLAYLFELTGRYTEAETLYREALGIAVRQLGKNHADYGLYLGNLATLYSLTNRYSKAEASYREAKDIVSQSLGKNHFQYAMAIQNLAGLYFTTGKLKQSEPLYIEAIGILEKSVGTQHPTYARVLRSQGLLYNRLGNFSRAHSNLTAANSADLYHIENYFPALSDAEKDAYYKSLKEGLDAFNSFCIEHASNDPSLKVEMFNLQLATKALLLNSATKWKLRIKASGDKKLVSLYSQWENNQALLARLYQTPGAVNRARIDSIGLLTNSLEKELSKKSELFLSLSEKKRNTWLDVKAALKPNEVAVEIIRARKLGVKGIVRDTSDVNLPTYAHYGMTDTVYYAALIVTAQSAFPELVVLENGKDLEKKYIKQYHNLLRSQLADPESYALFWKPVAKVINKSAGPHASIIVSPDGVFNLINLNTLYNPETDKFVVDESNLGLVTNIRDILTVKLNNASNNSAYLFGYPDYGAKNEVRARQVTDHKEAGSGTYTLSIERGSDLTELPETKTEVEAIAHLLNEKGWRSDVLTGDQALEEKVKSCYQPRVLHIATHGYFNADTSAVSNPLVRSGLLLAGAAETLNGKTDPRLDDGILTAYEAMNLNLDNTELIALSACDTGLGDVRNGEGVYGLQRAFKVAGANTIIMSLWKVDDEATRELMAAFYKYWLDTGDKLLAFQQAQLKLKEKYKSPVYWGAFVMLE